MDQVATLISRFEAGISTAIPVILWSFIALWGINTIFPFDIYLAQYGLSKWHSEVLSVAVVLTLPLFWVILDGSIARATYGMRKRNIRFGNPDGMQINIGRCIIRIVAGIVLFPLFPISLMIALMDKRHRTIADRLCKTVVWNAQLREQKKVTT